MPCEKLWCIQWMWYLSALDKWGLPKESKKVPSWQEPRPSSFWNVSEAFKSISSSEWPSHQSKFIWIERVSLQSQHSEILYLIAIVAGVISSTITDADVQNLFITTTQLIVLVYCMRNWADLGKGKLCRRSIWLHKLGENDCWLQDLVGNLFLPYCWKIFSLKQDLLGNKSV